MSSGYIELARAQQEHWQGSYRANPRLHGAEPSEPARWAAKLFTDAGVDDVLELGAGHGRDALCFARAGFSVHATDFCDAALHQLRCDARAEALDDRVTAALHDVRDPLPLADATVGAVYAHLLMSMALSTHELHALTNEVRRVLRPNGLFVYTALHSGDTELRTGQIRGDDLYDFDGLTVRFFGRELVDELGTGWQRRDVAEMTDGAPQHPIWRVVQVRPDA